MIVPIRDATRLRLGPVPVMNKESLSLSTLLASEIPHPSDFPPPQFAPGLRALDSSLRCNICGELYEAPVTLACGHCFCSVVSEAFHNSFHLCSFLFYFALELF